MSMWLKSTEVKAKYGISPGHCRRDMLAHGCRTKPYTFCGKTVLSYYEPDVKRIVEERDAKKKKAKDRYAARPDVMRGTRSKLKKVLPDKMYKKLQNAWFGMMRRCYTNDRPDYRHYREFGITICDEWLNSFDEFALWSLNNGVDYPLSLDRIDNDKGYSPENCRWVTKIVQGNNTSVNRVVRYMGEEKTIAELAAEYGIKYHTLYYRIVTKGWPVEEALEISVTKK